jgi:leucyl aminopeptidase
MRTELLFRDAADLATPLLAVFAVDISTTKDKPLPGLLTTSGTISKAAERFLGSGEFKATANETLLLHSPSGLKAERLLIIGLGAAKSFNANDIRRAAGTAIRFAKPRGIRSLAIAFPEDRALSDEHLESLPCGLTARALIEGASLADFDPDTYQSDRKDRSIQDLTVVSKEEEKTTTDEITLGFSEGLILSGAQNFARSLVNEPGNVLTPTVLGERAAAMCKENGLHCEVHSTEKLQELKMGAFAAVAQGSAQPPALIIMRYEPETAPPVGSPILGLVGKGITFDTGGISIKPADGMEKMKYDMGGAAAMIGAMQAIAQLKPAVRVLSIICSAENMPGGKAYKPGDVVTAMSGKTIEVINTDAEGRLVLADGLYFARQLGATHLINAATLTGACVVALGTLNAGLFSNNEEAAEKFAAAARAAGESFWRLPCTDDYREMIKSHIADIRNTGGSRWGGATTAAMFLKEFVGETPWLHLDIAGMAWLEEQKPWMPTGPTGIAVRSIVAWARGFAGN